jgi:FdhD protein
MESYRVIHYENGLYRNGDHELIQEEPLLIRVDNKPYSIVMRTPGEEISHAAGFCLAEGLVDRRDDFTTLDFNRDLAPNIVDVSLTPERLEKISDILERRGFISQTSCGICGKEMAEDLYQILVPAEHNINIEIDNVFMCIEKLFESQVKYNKTRGSHAAILFNSRFDTLSFSEDVGRHNALDKVIGTLFSDGDLDEAVIVALTSRISYEIMQKVARARLPIIVSKSRPTALAVEMGKNLNMTLACVPNKSELIIYCGEKRIITK